MSSKESTCLFSSGTFTTVFFLNMCSLIYTNNTHLMNLHLNTVENYLKKCEVINHYPNHIGPKSRSNVALTQRITTTDLPAKVSTMISGEIFVYSYTLHILRNILLALPIKSSSKLLEHTYTNLFYLGLLSWYPKRVLYEQIDLVYWISVFVHLCLCTVYVIAW